VGFSKIFMGLAYRFLYIFFVSTDFDLKRSLTLLTILRTLDSCIYIILFIEVISLMG
jgi:hypothetical protein